MTNEEKQLLLKDLCGRLLYRTKVSYNGKDEVLSTLHIFDMTQIKEEYVNIKPYLRPMSSMTEEERNEYFDFRNQELQRVAFAEVGREAAIAEISDWLNSHHFDYRGLIEKNLAIAVTEENNPYK